MRTHLVTTLLGLALVVAAAACSEDENGKPTPDKGTDSHAAVEAGTEGGVDTAPTTEGGTVDTTSPIEGGTVDTTPAIEGGPDAAVSPYTLVITEIMANPAAVSDNSGEWFEIYNPGSASVDIEGWTITDQVSSPSTQDKHTIAATGGTLPIAAGAYLVLGSNSSTSTNGGVTVAYAYSTWYLANSADEIYLYDKQMKLVDNVEYDTVKSWPVPNGASMSLKDPTKDNNVAANWCTEADSWTGSAGDKGSPGAAAGTNCK